MVGFGQYATDWQPAIYALAVLSLLVGAVLAVVQTDVKRMLAYSSISHAGFVLVGVQAASEDGTAAALFYLGAYTFMVAGSFGVVTVVGAKARGNHSLETYRGLGSRRPMLALAFTIFDHQAEAPTWAGAPAPPEEEVRASYLEYLADPGVAYFLAERDGEPLGHVALERESDSTVYLSIAATAPEARGLGVGTVLTESALAWAHEEGYARCVTDWRSANLLAARFWPSQGFRTTAFRLYRPIRLTPRDRHLRSAPA